MTPSGFWRQFHGFVESVLTNMARNPEAVSLMLAFSLLFLINQIDENRGFVQPPKVPTPLFQSNSPVAEFYTGDLNIALEYIKMAATDVWLVMYYAHWDAASLEAAVEFELLAREFKDEVTFVAVNCWWPYGSCKFRVKPPMYPIFVGHVVGREGVQYTGIQKYAEMKAFLNKLQVPFKYIQQEEDVLSLRAHDDSIAVAYFNFSASLSPPGLNSFHQAALSSLERDPIQPTPFAVVTNVDIAKSLGLNTSKSLVLLRNFNYTAVFPETERFKAANILSWVYGEAREQYVEWISPAGTKSTIVSSQLLQAPSLLFFTNFQEGRGFQNNFYMLRKVMLQYYQCEDNHKELIDDIINYIQGARNIKTSPKCVTKLPPTQCCQSLATIDPLESIKAKGNICEVCEQSSLPYSFSFDYCSVTSGRSCHALWPLFGDKIFGIPNSCNYMNNFYSPYSFCELCCDGENRISSRHYSKYQYPVLERIHRLGGEHCVQCDNHIRGKETQQEDVCDSRTYDEEEQYALEELDGFLGLGCRVNMSLNFFAVRKEYFSVLAQRLGIEETKLEGDGDIAMIVDEMNEEVFWHPTDKTVSTLSLQTFIYNYTEGELRRNLSSAESVTKHTGSCFTPSRTRCIEDVVTETFQQIVLDPTKHVLLLYYTPWCGACKSLAHTYLVLAQIFDTTENVVIARINGDENDLPWEYAPISYPTIILFPMNQKANSHLYPRDQPLTLPHLVRFVVQYTS